ncbi:MAG: glycoside hydrolase family 88 protein [Odoribacter sp.]|nr:glycoside hydrolase family 88 protein [Odoribacter sp.]
MKIYFLLISLLGILSCKPEKEFKNYSEWMAVSEITRNPQLWNVDFVPKPKWDYTQGLIAKTIFDVYEKQATKTIIRMCIRL